MNAAVVGAGIAGASVARSLANRGHRVVVFDQHPIGHDRGSSHGASRIVRKAYPDPFYTEIMGEGYGLWQELQEQAGRTILHESGLMYFGLADAPNVVSMLEGLKDLAVPHEALAPEAAAARLPRLRLKPGEIGIFTPEAGWVDAAEAIGSCIRIASELDAEIRHTRIESADQLRDFDRFVLCPGPWLARLVDIEVSITLQTFSYVDGSMEGPVWIEDSPDLCYGFPSEPGVSGFKIGVHRLGREADPDLPDRKPSAEAQERIRKLARDRFGIHDPGLFGQKGCLYTNTADEHFRWGRVGERGFFCSACSGHGFKFGPWLGERLADFVEEKGSPESIPRFCQP